MFLMRLFPDIQQEKKPGVATSSAPFATLKEIEGREPTESERAILRRFPGFGCVALSIFPDPRTRQFKEGWEQIGRALQGAADRR